MTDPTLSGFKHCDDYISDLRASKPLRFFLLIQRLPASESMLCREFGVKPTLFADYKGARVRVVMASRLGDVGITTHLTVRDSDDDFVSYTKRVMVSELTNFSTTAKED